MRVEDIQELFRELKAEAEAGTITEEEFEDRVRNLLFRDEEGRYWTIGAQTEKWYRYEEDEWIQDSPPPALERAEDEDSAPHEKAEATVPERERRFSRRVVIGTAAAVFVVCALLAAAGAYQLGKMSAASRGATHSPTPSSGAMETPTARPSPSLAPTDTPSVPAAEPSSPEAEATPTEPSPSPTRQPTVASTPLATPTPEATPSYVHASPTLVFPEDGAQFGPRYEAVLEWEAVPGLGEDEYYHVEVWWNDYAARWGDYVREATTTFPSSPGFYRGEAIDGRYEWHVTVRRQQGEEPAGPSDPATSPPSETWVFLLPED
jgi:hypothetical protein